MTPSEFVLRVVKVLPQVQVTWVSTYVGWMSGFMGVLLVPAPGRHVGIDGREPAPTDQSAAAQPAAPNSPTWSGSDLVPRVRLRSLLAPVRDRLGDGPQELGVAAGLAQPVQQHLQALQVLSTGEHAAQLPDDVELLAAHQQLLATGAGGVDVDGREDPLVGELAPQSQLHVAGALELLEDHLVHLRTGLDQGRRQDGQRATVLDV